MKTKKSVTSKLTLGWNVSTGWDPKYWNNSKAKAGYQKDDDLVQVPPSSMACHTAIIAQSGSGKSFFLARLIEEIVLNTKARCVILDPNADFKKIYEIEDADLWSKAKYDTIIRTGKLPHEKTQTEFSDIWDKIRINIKSSSYIDPSNKYSESLKLDWPSVSVDFLAEDTDPIIRNELYHCHIFTESIFFLSKVKNSIESGKKNNRSFIQDAERIYKIAKSLDTTDVKLAFSEFDDEALSKSESQLFEFYPPDYKESLIDMQVKGAKIRAQNAIKYMSIEIAKYYFGKVQEYSATGIINTTEIDVSKLPSRIEVIDLPSIKDKKTRLLVVNSILAKEWSNAQSKWNRALEKKIKEDDRVPTFIIIDEAHNLIPAEPSNKSEITLREQFRTIISEGRKYGLFLIIASQRPDKLDSMVLSECDNKAIMKLSSESVLEITKKLLSLDSGTNKLLEDTLNLETGRGILIGKWTSNIPVKFFSAARRTIEGGRNLRDEFWAVPANPSGPIKPVVPIKRIVRKRIAASKRSTSLDK